MSEPPRGAPSSEVVVRLARDDEVEAVGALTVAGYDAEGYLVLTDGTYDHDYAAWLGDAAPRLGDLLVAVDGDDFINTVGEELLGTVTWCPPGSTHRQVATHDHQGEFRTLSVSPAARRRGIGALLVADCLRRGREIGLDEVVLCSLPEMTPAHRLYATFGFERRPDLDWDPIPGVHLWGFSAALDPDSAPSGPSG